MGSILSPILGFNIGLNIGLNIVFNIRLNIGLNIWLNIVFNIGFNIGYNIGFNISPLSHGKTDLPGLPAFNQPRMIHKPGERVWEHGPGRSSEARIFQQEFLHQLEDVDSRGKLAHPASAVSPS